MAEKKKLELQVHAKVWRAIAKLLDAATEGDLGNDEKTDEILACFTGKLSDNRGWFPRLKMLALDRAGELESMPAAEMEILTKEFHTACALYPCYQDDRNIDKCPIIKRQNESYKDLDAMIDTIKNWRDEFQKNHPVEKRTEGDQKLIDITNKFLFSIWSKTGMPTCIDGKYNWKNIFEKNMKAAAKSAIFEDRGIKPDRQGDNLDREEANYVIHVHFQRAKRVAELIAISLLA